MKTFLVIGASRGIGASVVRHLIAQKHAVVGVSRTKPVLGEWIQADISTPDGIKKGVRFNWRSAVRRLSLSRWGLGERC